MGADLTHSFTVRNMGSLLAYVGIGIFAEQNTSGGPVPFSVEGTDVFWNGNYVNGEKELVVSPNGQPRTITVRFRPTQVGIFRYKMVFAYADVQDEVDRQLPVSLRGRAILAALATSKGAKSDDFSNVAVFNPFNFNASYSYFQAYPDIFKGGSTLASCDFDGDGYPEIVTGAGPGGYPHVVVYRGNEPNRGFHNPSSMMASFLAYDAAFRGGVTVACGDINADAVPDLITGAGPDGGPHVTVVDGTKLSGSWEVGKPEADGKYIRSFYAYHVDFRGGIWVAAGDVNADGRMDIITGAQAGGGPHVMAFNGQFVDMGYAEPASHLLSFMAYEPSFGGGVHVAAGDIDANRRDEVITGAGPGGGSHVIAYDASLCPSYGTASSMLRSFYAYEAFAGGVRVAAFDVNRDDKDDIITGAGPTGGPHLRIINGTDSSADMATTDGDILSRFVFDQNFTGGIFVTGSK